MPRYQVSGIPPVMAGLGMSAFMPHYNRLAASGAQSFKGGVTGRPGTHPIPVRPHTQGIPPQPGSNDMAIMGTARSSDAPDAIWPNQYWTRTDPLYDTSGGTARVEVYTPTRPQDTTIIPVPAVDLRSVYQERAAMSGGVAANQGSRGAALRQAMAFVRWPGRRTGNDPGTGSP